MSGQMAWWREPTRGQWFSFGAAWLGWVLDAFDFTIFFLAMPYIAKEFGVSDSAAAGSVTLTLLMRLLGGVLAGAAADRWGRKLPLMISIVWFAACDGLVALAGSFSTVLILRTLFGFGMGAEWTSGATLAMENWPARSRGLASGILQGSWAIGYLLASLAFAWVMPLWGWRALFVLAAVPALLVLPIRIWVPESPEWAQSREAAAPPAWKELLEPGVVRRLAWAALVLALGFSVYYALTSLYPTMLKKELALQPDRIAGLIALFNVGMLIGAVACGVLASKKGVVTAVMVPALAMLPLLPLYVGLAGPLEVGAFLGGLVGVSFSGVTPALLADLFPARIRARAAGVVYHVGAAFAAFIPPLVAGLPAIAGISLAVAIILVSGVCQVLLAGGLLLKPGQVAEGTGAATPPAEALHA